MADVPIRRDWLAQRLGIGLARTGPRDPIARSLERFRLGVQGSAVAGVSDAFFRSISRMGQLHPLSRPERHQVQVLPDIPYADDGLPEHTLDIYRPTVRPGPWPVVLYVHGGGFRLLSKDTHWLMGLVFARFGYLVFNVSYRLAPEHPYPAAIQDVCAAYEWVVRHAERYGGDLDRLVVAGESAGANLVTSLSLAACYPRSEPWARRVFDTGVAPSAAVPACGIFQVSNTRRFSSRRPLPIWVRMVLGDVEDSYLGGAELDDEVALELADPVRVFEAGWPPARDLPAFFVPVGTRDPLLPDTRRLAAALDALGVPCEPRYYPGEIHAFHALVWRRQARRCWQDTLAFLDRTLRGGRAGTGDDGTGAAA